MSDSHSQDKRRRRPPTMKEAALRVVHRLQDAGFVALFAGGCGRVFEGTFPMMHASLKKLAVLPEDTAVYCAHEYTLANLTFARAVEPDNQALADRIAAAEATRARSEATVPSTLGLELATNPFLRAETPALVAALSASGKLEGETGDEVFATVRGWKDNF